MSDQSRGSFLLATGAAGVALSLPQFAFADGKVADPDLSGPMRPVTEEIVAARLGITGRVPDDLRGTYIRNGPNPAFPPISYVYPFDGDGMLHSIALDGQTATYRNRWVQTRGLKAERRAGRAIYGSLLHPLPADASLLQSGDEPLIKNVANTHVIRHANRILALYEGGLPYEVSETLETIGSFDYAGALQDSMAAHTRLDASTGELHFFRYSLDRKPYITYYVSDASGRIVRSRPVDTGYPSMVHDCTITANKIIFATTPLKISFAAVRRGMSPVQYDPTLGTTFFVVDRHDLSQPVRSFTTGPFFFFHYANAYEDGTLTIVDLVRHGGFGKGGPPPAFARITLDAATGNSSVRQSDDRAVEFPSVNARYMGKSYRFAYAASVYGTDVPRHCFDALYRFDCITSTSQVRRMPKGHFVGEPAIVPKSSARSEDDVWILLLDYDAANDRSALLILDGLDLHGEVVASVELPVRVPLGLHGSWMPATQ